MKAREEYEEDEGALLWKRTVETLIKQGASPAEAVDGANLVLQAYRRDRTAAEAPASDDGGRASGVRRCRA